MNDNDVELISAYLDNELDKEHREVVEQRLVTDEDFAEMFANFEQNDNAIKASYAQIDNKPLPEGLSALLSDEQQAPKSAQGEKIDIAVPAANDSVFSFKKWMPMAAAFATVALSVHLVLNDDDASRMTLAQALDSVSSGNEAILEDASNLEMVMSFENNQGQLCREYRLVNAEKRSLNIACKGSTRWENMISADIDYTESQQFQAASAQTSIEIEQWLDDNMASEAFTIPKEAERLAKSK